MWWDWTQVRRCLYALAAVPELDAVSAVRMAEVRIDGDPATVSGIDPVAIDEVALLGIMKGSLARLDGGGILRTRTSRPSTAVDRRLRAG